MAQFRVCPDSGFYFDKNAESLMKANAVAGAVFLLVAGVLGLGVILTRWQEVHLLPAHIFYQVLTGHGINAQIFWIVRRTGQGFARQLGLGFQLIGFDVNTTHRRRQSVQSAGF